MGKVDKYLKKLHEKDSEIKIKALIELGNLKDSEGVTQIFRTAEDEDERVRTQTAITLGQIGDIQAGEIILKLAIDDDPAVRMEAATSLGVFGARGYSPSKEALENMLNEENYRVRKYAIIALGNCGERDTIDKLSEIFTRDKTSTELKEAIATSIGKIGGSHAMEILNSWVLTGTMEVRRDVINALGTIANEAAADVLIHLMTDEKEDKVIRKHAKEALKNIVKVAKDNYINLKNRIECYF
ncbi:MAG: HEAT repeat domain-containing protein [archaeon]|nr:HEAT repeat domain-containing protein [archaeon]